ncbi:MAG: hypothetical protein C0605_13645 [Hyphomicrobiales bacterium]|nr:MAG: hypothetical protein C0605_13645 [Hyphomicrobiales bacterium]
MNDMIGHTTPDPGAPGHSESGLAPVYSLDMNEVSGLFDEARLPRSRRTLLRYCQHDKLDCTKVETVHGEQYFVSEASVQRLIAEILERERFTRPPTGADTYPGAPRQTPTSLAPNGFENGHLGNDEHTPPDHGGASHDEGIHPTLTDERLLEQVQGENELLRNQMEVKDNQIERMNGQIDDLIERGKEDKVLIQNFQRKLGMLEAPREGEWHAEPYEPQNSRKVPISTEPVDSTSEEASGMV